ncbi:nickel/cobalt transporter [Spirochaeta dissipatitropha]
MHKLNLLFLILFISIISMIRLSPAAYANPFTDGTGQQMTPRAGTENSSEAVDGTVFRRVSGIFPAQVQRSFNRQLSELMDGGTEAGFLTMFLIAAIALGYGMVHAALPGHRKTLLLAYFIGSDSRPRHAVIAGISTALLHSFAAAVVVLVAWFFLNVSITAAVGSTTVVIQRITALAAIAIGFVMLWPKIRLIKTPGDHHSSHAHDENCSCNRPPGRIARWVGQGRMLPAIVLSSTFPCPGSSMILLFALAVGNLAVGLLAISMFAFGMAITLVTVCLLAVTGKHHLFEHVGGRFGNVLHHGIEIVAAVAIILFGIFWMWSGPVY